MAISTKDAARPSRLSLLSMLESMLVNPPQKVSTPNTYSQKAKPVTLARVHDPEGDQRHHRCRTANRDACA